MHLVRSRQQEIGRPRAIEEPQAEGLSMDDVARSFLQACPEQAMSISASYGRRSKVAADRRVA
jgi:hypothetical protein